MKGNGVRLSYQLSFTYNVSIITLPFHHTNTIHTHFTNKQHTHANYATTTSTQTPTT